MHYENIRTLLECKIPVICEKPLVSTVDEAETLKSLAKESFLVVTNNYSGYPMLRELKARIERGDFGDIINIRLQMPQETFMRPPKNINYPQPWRLNDGSIPMICLDLGVHLHHLMVFLTGKEPLKVMAEFNSFSKYKVIDDVNIWLEFDDSSKASMWMSKSALGHRNGMAVDVFGTKGSASWVQMKPEILNLAYFDGTKSVVDRGCECLVANLPRYARMTSGHPAGFIEAFANLYYDIADTLTQFKDHGTWSNPYVFGLEHALNGLKMFNQAGKAHETPNWVEVH
jgi:predicted dehydrogenase